MGLVIAQFPALNASIGAEHSRRVMSGPRRAKHVVRRARRDSSAARTTRFLWCRSDGPVELAPLAGELEPVCLRLLSGGSLAAPDHRTHPPVSPRSRAGGSGDEFLLTAAMRSSSL